MGLREWALQALLISLTLINDDSSSTEGSCAFANTTFQRTKIWKWAEVGNVFLALLEEQVQKKHQVFVSMSPNIKDLFKNKYLRPYLS